MGQPHDMVGRDQSGTGRGPRHHHHRIGAKRIGNQRLVFEGTGVGVDQQVDSRVRMQSRQADDAAGRKKDRESEQEQRPARGSREQRDR